MIKNAEMNKRKLSMKKIVVLENNFTASVTIRSALMNALANNGFEVYILSYGKAEFAEQLKNIMATCIDIGTSNTNPIEVLKYLKTVYKEIKNINPDVCLTFTPRQNIYGNIVCKMLRIPTLSNITGTGVPFHIKGLIYAFGRLLYKMVLKIPKTVFFQNIDDFEHLISKGYVEKTQAVLIPGSGIETGKFVPIEKVQTNKFVFLFVGRLVKIKGVEEMVIAARNILKDRQDIEFWIVGPLWTQNTGSLTITQNDLNNWQNEGIIYKGETKDVRPFIAQCDCFVLASYREGLSNSLLEAASMERPIVTTNVTGCRDVVVDGLNGILCEAQNAASLENALRKMLALNNDERKEMGKQGRIKVKREYEKTIVVNKYIEQIIKIE